MGDPYSKDKTTALTKDPKDQQRMKDLL